jgi:hypothetical protein
LNPVYPNLACDHGSFAAGNCTVAGIQFTGGGAPLGPERATQYTGGLELAPTQIPGLDVQATYYHVSDKGRIAQLGNGTTILSDPTLGYLINTNPTSAQIEALINSPNSTVTPGTSPSSAHFIADALWHNFGTLITAGWDINANYTLNTDFGIWNVGALANIMTTYKQSATAGSPLVSSLGITHAAVSTRGQLGWTEDGWNVTGFVNFMNGNWNAIAAPAPLPTHIPSYTTFDLSFGYDTGTNPASSYLKNVRLQIVVNDVFNKLPPFAYFSSALTGTAAFDLGDYDPTGRMVSVTLTKDW